MLKKFFLIFFLLILAALFIPKWARAISFNVVPPSGTLTRDQEYDFFITVDTQGEQITTTRARVTYESQYLQLVSVTNGDFFDSITNEETQVGSILLTGTNNTAKAGSGNFAVIRFKLIATAPGSTTLCTVAPEDTPTPVPTAVPTSPPPPVYTPVPTAIPQAGSIIGWQVGSLVALGLIGLGILGVLFL